MASAARLLAPISRRGVVSVALAGVERRRPEAALLLGAPVLATVEACASTLMGSIASSIGKMGRRRTESSEQVDDKP
uniref:Uncharacterized protein n=1 Tax=Zea mays TaxID=4577 RepID=B6T689_MAIZE|nr:hypothetical protein [Zea mays]